MAIDFTGDYAFWDGSEAVTLVRSASHGDSETSVSTALRLPLSTREVATSNGAYTSQDVRWLIPGALAVGDQAPKPGDLIRSNNEYGNLVDWTILDRSYSTMTAVYRCTTRDLVLSADLRDSLSVRRPLNSKDAAGKRVSAYQEIYADVPAKIQEMESEPTDAFGTKSWKKKYVAYVGRRLVVQNEDQVHCGGKIYQLVGYRNPDRFDLLQELDLEIMP